MPFQPLTELRTERLLLRPVAATDLPDLMAVLGDPVVTRFLPHDAWRTLADATAWLDRMMAVAASGTGQQLVIVHPATGRAIGTLLLFRYDESSARIEWGYTLGRAQWKQGFMHEALSALGEQAFTVGGIRRVEAEVNLDNLASVAVLRRLGFVREGTFRQRWVAKGSAYDTHLFGCLHPDWTPALIPTNRRTA